ncbi:MAG: ChuX/HutX family heme-like substrate-binding protein [Amaricoccus sp.]|uniref:hemin-degrading factor n=1 Tax=Amaricoccus sp. TaxID=1872485 RepID=UPI0039E22335
MSATADLRAREAALRASGATPPRMRDLAATLGVPEAALLEARRDEGQAVRLLRPEAPEGFGTILAGLPGCGEVMTLVRNEVCVHELTGRPSEPAIDGPVGQFVGQIDLRLFLQHWRYGYCLDEETRSGWRRSLQFFDAAGTAILKVYATAGTDRAAFDRLAAAFAAPDAPAAAFAAPAARPAERPDGEVDVAGFRAAWDGLQMTHEFFFLLGRFGISRGQAMRLAGDGRARAVPVSAVRALLDGAATVGMPVMVFVSNRGCVQIHAGPVVRIEPVGAWLNVLDPGFNLHLRTDLVASAWVVRKPSVNGEIHSLELCDAAGELVCQIFGHRVAGGVERDDWRALVTGLAA